MLHTDPFRPAPRWLRGIASALLAVPLAVALVTLLTPTPPVTAQPIFGGSTVYSGTATTVTAPWTFNVAPVIADVASGNAITINAQTGTVSEGNLVFLGGIGQATGHIMLQGAHIWRGNVGNVDAEATTGPPVIRVNTGTVSNADDGHALIVSTGVTSNGVTLWGVGNATPGTFTSGTKVCNQHGMSCDWSMTVSATPVTTFACGEVNSVTTFMVGCH